MQMILVTVHKECQTLFSLKKLKKKKIKILSAAVVIGILTGYKWLYIVIAEM